jgi:hypothetical protein
MMFQEATFKMTYVEEICGGELNMVIVLPEENTDLKMLMCV